MVLLPGLIISALKAEAERTALTKAVIAAMGVSAPALSNPKQTKRTEKQTKRDIDKLYALIDNPDNWGQR